MRRARLHIAILLLMFGAFGSASSTQPESVRVRIYASSMSVLVTGNELSINGEPVSEKTLRINWVQGKKQAQWKVGAKEIEGSTFGIQGSALRVNGELAPSSLTFVTGVKSRINVVAEIPLEEYVAGVVAAEMPISWPMEALMAQAIAARSYVVAQMRSQKHHLFHTDSSQNNQVFKWIGGQNSNEMVRARDAVRKTANVILTDKRGRPLWAYYHADCGGHTEEPHAVWKNNQHYGTVKDGSCPARPNTKWNAEVSFRTLNTKLRPFVGGKGKIVGVDLGSKSNSGRINSLILKMEDGSHEVIDGNRFRQALGFNWIKSTMFDLKLSGGVLRLTGQGFGHGAGLCQWGARALARGGKSHTAILKNYYPSAKVGAVKATF